MPRLCRYFLPDQPQHVIQRGNNRTPIFFRSDDYSCYRDWLGAAASQHGCAVHAYVLMTNHVHLLLSPRDAMSIARTLQSLGRRYVRHLNERDHRSGTLWEGRYRTTVIDSEAYFLACSRYIELNPVRAGMVAQAQDYRWSSFRHNGGGATDHLITEHPIYLSLGGHADERCRAYRDLVAAALDPHVVEDLAPRNQWRLGARRGGVQAASRANHGPAQRAVAAWTSCQGRRPTQRRAGSKKSTLTPIKTLGAEFGSPTPLAGKVGHR